MLIFLRNILQLILAPAKGWEDVSGAMTDPQVLVKKYFFAVLAVSALSEFVRLVYDTRLLFVVLLIRAMVVFVSYFVSFYFALVMFKTYFWHFCEGEPNPRKFTTVIAYCICLLALSTIVCNVLPVNLGLQYLLPLAVALILWKADIYLRVRSQSDMLYALFGLCVVVLPPTVIQTIFFSIFSI